MHISKYANKDMKKIIMIIFFIGLGLGALAFTGWTIRQDISNKIFENENPSISENITQNEYKILNDMHCMTNTLIEAADGEKWGAKEMNMENIIDLKNRINKINMLEKDKLFAILQKWENNDFSNIVNDHNYVWLRLGGSVGKASKPNSNIVNGKYINFK